VGWVSQRLDHWAVAFLVGAQRVLPGLLGVAPSATSLRAHRLAAAFELDASRGGEARQRRAVIVVPIEAANVGIGNVNFCVSPSENAVIGPQSR